MNDVIQFDFNDEKLVNLTAMFAKAVEAGKAEGKSDPRDWSRRAGKTFIAKLAQSLNVANCHIYVSKRGKNGGTWAHWQIGCAYSHYLDEMLHMEFNAQVRALHIGDVRVFNTLLRNTNEYEQRRMLSKLTRKMWTDRVQASGVEDESGMVYGQLTNIITKKLLGAKPDVVKEQRGLSKTASLRDNLSHTELVRMTLAESMSADMMEQGKDPYESCRIAADIVSRTKTP